MNAQTLNRMIKASYYAPNGAELRKACYGLISLTSRKASSMRVADVQEQLEQLEQLPEKEQDSIKAKIVGQALIQGSKEAQKDGAKYGLLEVKSFLAQEGISMEEFTSLVKQAKQQKELVSASKKLVKSDVGFFTTCKKIISAFSFEEIANILDIPIDWLQRQFEETNYLKLISVAVLSYVFLLLFMNLIGGSAIVLEVGSKLLALNNSYTIALTGLAGIGAGFIPLFIEYLFGNVAKWIQKRFGMLLGFVATLPFRFFALLTKFNGWLLDKFFSSLSGAFKRFFSRQASIAMQSPEFRRAYYNI
jgi:hypothetical protein